MRIVDDQCMLYQHLAELLECDEAQPSQRKISIASLHGQGGRRTTSEPAEDGPLGMALAAFSAAMIARIRDPVAPWEVRQLLNITSQDRLDQVVARQLSVEGANYEVRAIVDPHVISVLAPLIIGQKHAFLAVDDQRLFRAASAVHLRGPRAANWALHYFDSLWDGAQFRIRDKVGVRPDEIERVRTALDLLQSSQSTPAALRFASEMAIRGADLSFLSEPVAALIARGEGRM